MKPLVLLLTVSLVLVTAYDYKRTDECLETDEECHFIFIVESKLTMINTDKRILVKPSNGKLYNIDDTNMSYPIMESDKVIQTDGYYQNPRLVIVVNNSLPGPAIEVYEGQNVTVEVRNRLLSEGVTVHWHGVLQKNNNFMDGVSYVNQCPIAPETSFTYSFQVINQGTDFYHAHIGAQRTQGLFGPVITRRKTKARIMPMDQYEDFIVVVNDWNHDYDSNTGHLKSMYGIYDENGTKFKPHRSHDFSKFSAFKWHAGLINGRGRYYDPETGNHNEAPLEVFRVSSGEIYRFRVISAGTSFPLRISIDQHELRMISSDGYEFEEYPVESFILSPGERFDFIVTANQHAGSYWIYAETTETDIDTGRPPVPAHRAEAIFEYEESPMPDTNYDANVVTWSNRSRCTAANVCNVLNCPFGEEFVIDDHQVCKHFTHLTSLTDPELPDDAVYEERFYNFAFAGSEGGSINGRHWVYPSFSAASQKAELEDVNTKCNECTKDKTCTCTNTDVLEHNKYYQFVFINNGKGSGAGHPIHLHGHKFQVVKQGFHPLNDETGKLPDGNHNNPDLKCYGEITCNSAEWYNLTWSGSGLNDQIVAKPVHKDTVMVPSGGYTVIRFRADNPGFWFMHCHIELHNLAGMAMMFNEASANQDEPPMSFPECRNFPSKYGDKGSHATHSSSNSLIFTVCWLFPMVVERWH